MSIHEYDEEATRQAIHTEGYKQSIEKGYAQGIERGIESLILDNIESGTNLSIRLSGIKITPVIII